ncbi:MAG: DUF515 domain-containing protein [Nanoarchaeota archaeon]|nr:DUF515 domain-containing protein [Nanoarchaeota archaeon]
MKKKRGQVTIFIILSIVLIGSLILFFLVREGIVPQFWGGGEINPDLFLQTCLEEKIESTIDILSSQGGYIENSLSKEFDGKNISYLCYNSLNYYTCINQEPLLIQHLKNEIKKEISEEVKNCFNELSLNLEKEAYTVDAKYHDFAIDLESKKVIVKINGEMTLTKNSETLKHDDFIIVVKSSFYDLAIIAQEIISQESEFCNFNYLGYMLLHPEISIELNNLGDQTSIYHLQHRKTDEDFWFALRTCALPGGI